jgi:hypothetical protein
MSLSHTGKMQYLLNHYLSAAHDRAVIHAITVTGWTVMTVTGYFKLSCRAQLPATLKQELVCTLLEVLSQHPSAEAALKLPPGKPVPPPPPPGTAAAAAAAPAAVTNSTKQQQQSPDTAFAAADSQPADGSSNGSLAAVPAAAAAAAGSAAGPVAAAAAAAAVSVRPQFGPDDISASPIVASLQSQVVLWLGAAVAALQHTRACLHWEPLVPPPMPGMTLTLNFTLNFDFSSSLLSFHIFWPVGVDSGSCCVACPNVCHISMLLLLVFPLLS